jgi:hypothetical protein
MQKNSNCFVPLHPKNVKMDDETFCNINMSVSVGDGSICQSAEQRKG